MKKTTDLCIIGCAGAGISAAVRAKECGIEHVLVLEKMKRPGGCTVVAGGIMGIDSPAQKRWGIRVDRDDVFLSIMEHTGWDCNTQLVRRWINKSGDILAWVESKGMEFDTVMAMSNPDGYQEYHTIKSFKGGKVMFDLMYGEAVKNGVEIMTETAGEHLITDESGAVIGVKARCGEEEIEISAKAVILATGSISADEELVRHFYPYTDLTHFHSMAGQFKHNTGDGYRMAMEVNAAECPISTLYIGPQNHPHNMRTAHLLKRPETVKVTRDGVRYQDEYVQNGHRKFGWMSGSALNSIPGHICYAIFDQGILDHIRETRVETSTAETRPYKLGELNRDSIETNYLGKGKFLAAQQASPMGWLDYIDEDIASEQAQGRILVADTLEEVAAYIGCDVDTLKETLDQYNEFCRRGYDAEFVKDPRFLLPLRKGPYYVIQGRPGFDTNVGGVRVNYKLQVVDKDEWKPIPNLYAAGVCAGSWLGKDTYAFPGSEMSFTFYSGYTAAEEVAKQILGKK